MKEHESILSVHQSVQRGSALLYGFCSDPRARLLLFTSTTSLIIICIAATHSELFSGYLSEYVVLDAETLSRKCVAEKNSFFYFCFWRCCSVCLSSSSGSTFIADTRNPNYGSLKLSHPYSALPFLPAHTTYTDIERSTDC